MLRLRTAHAALVLLATLLAACGGGGGGGTGGSSNGGGGSTTTPAASPALTFSPSIVTASVNAGTTLTLNVIAAVERPADFSGATVYASLVDSAGVLLPSAQVVRDSDTQYHAVLQTSPSLATGNYQGSFSVRLCRDSACASQFPGAPVALPYNLTVVPAGTATFTVVPAMPLTASAQSGTSSPPNVTIAITSAGRSWTTSSGASWLKVSAASGSGNTTVSASFDPTGLSAGSYSTTLTVLASDNQQVVLPATLTVLPPGLVLGANSITFNAVNGAPVPSQIVSLNTDNQLTASWTASSNSNWLSVSPTSGATPATTVLTVDPTVGSLVSGSYSAAITIVPSGLTTRTLPVTLNLSPATLLASSSTLTLGGTYGRDFSSSQTLSLSLNTSTNSWPWTLSNLPGWATVGSATGTVNQAGASTSISANASAATVGISSQLLGFSATANGDTVKTSVLLTINKDQHKLLPAETAVAFTSTPSWSRLTRTIAVTDNYGNFGGMSASSDATWLTVTVSANQLVLTADPTALSSDSVNSATITITPTDSDAVAPETIRVGLWKGSTTPTVGSALKATLPYISVVADPARPYAYAHNGGAYIDIYNVYTGLKEASMTGFSANLGDMAIAPNGDTLYLLDVNNARVTSVNLVTRSIAAQLPLAVAGNRSTRLKAIRPNGVALLVLSDGQIYRLSDSQRLSNLPLSGGGTIAVSADGKRLLQQDENGSSIQHSSVSIDYTAFSSGTLFAAKLATASHTSPGAQGQDIWVNSDGTRVIYAAATPLSCTLMDASNLGILSYMSSGDATPNNIEVSVDGRVFCGGIARSGNEVYLFDSSYKLISAYRVSSTGRQLQPRQMAVSGDGWIVSTISDDSALNFLPTGP